MSIKESEPSKRPRRLRIPIEPIHVEELLAGAGMNGFLGILNPPVSAAHLEKLVREVDTLSTKPHRDSGAPEVDSNGWDVGPAPRAPLEMSARVASVVLKVEALTELLKATTKNHYCETKMDGGSDKTR
jgi:hypothetical protein